MMAVTGFPVADAFTEVLDFHEERTLTVPDLALEVTICKLVSEGWNILQVRRSPCVVGYLVRVERREEFT